MGPNNPHFGYYGEQKRRPNIKLLALIGIGAIILFLVIYILAAFLNRDTIGTQAQHLSARLANLSAMTAATGTNLTNSDLQKINAETSIITDGATSDLSNVLPSKVDKSIAASEADTSDTTSLANAALDGTYNATYKKVLGQKLESIDALLTEMTAKSKSKTTRAALNRDDTNYQALLTNLTKITP